MATDYATVLSAVQVQGLMQRRRALYAVRIAALLLGFAGLAVAIPFLGHSWAQTALAAALGILVTQVLFLSHDAAHRQIFTSQRANEWAALLLGTGLGGISLAWWHSKHTRHHAAPNQIGKDPDIDASVVHFFPADKLLNGHRFKRFLHGTQGWWFYPLLVVEALNLHVQSVQHVIGRRGVKRRALELILLAMRLIGYPAALFLVLPAGIAGTFLGVQLAVTGLYLGATFAASHIGKPIVPADTKIDFFRRQVLMSRNVSGGRMASLAMGGLNYQIEHHLFPSMPRPNLRRARVIVRDFCHAHGIEYEEIRIDRAWLVVARYLNKVGLGGAVLYQCPTAAVLR